jgi:hypothetical protein
VTFHFTPSFPRSHYKKYYFWQRLILVVFGRNIWKIPKKWSYLKIYQELEKITQFKVNINKKSDLLHHVTMWRRKIDANPGHRSYHDEGIVPRYKKQTHHAITRSIVPRLRDFMSAFLTINRGPNYKDLTHWNSDSWRRLGSLQGSRRESFHLLKLYC